MKPATRADDDKLMSALQRLCDEDPSLTVTRDDETHQTILGVSGEVHLAVTFERLDRKCNVHVEREDLRIPYRETITRAAAAEGKHKKQSGGHGQFGVAHLRLEPLPRGSGFVFHDEVVGGAIPRQYIPAVEKGVLETFASGGRVRLPRGRHRGDGRRRQGALGRLERGQLQDGRGFGRQDRHGRGGADRAGAGVTALGHDPRRVPGRRAGRPVVTAGPHRRDRPRGLDGYQTVTATVPTAEITRYAVDLRALTGGRGSFAATYDHYDPVPEHMMASIPEGGGVARRHRASSGRQKTCWKRTGSLARISVPRGRCPGS